MIWIVEAQRCGGDRGALVIITYQGHPVKCLYKAAAKIIGFYWILKGKVQEGII